MKEHIIAVYEDGVLKPLTPVDFEDHQQVNLKIIAPKSIVEETRGMVPGNSKYIKEIAESKELEEWHI